MLLKRIWLVLVYIAMVPGYAWCDDTALNQGSDGPFPAGGVSGTTSVIQMVSEKIDIKLGKEFTDVDCHFIFRSKKKDAPAKQLVGFPDFGAAEAEDSRRRAQDPEYAKRPEMFEGDRGGPLQNVETYVNGQKRETELQFGWVSMRDGIYALAAQNEEDAVLMAWHTVPVAFPPDQDVVIERKYRAPNGSQASASQDRQVRLFYYTTATAAVWNGAVERMEVNVDFVDQLTVNDLFWKDPTGKQELGQSPCEPDKDQWRILSPTKLQLVWENFQPRIDDNRREFMLIFGYPGS